MAKGCENIRRKFKGYEHFLPFSEKHSNRVSGLKTSPLDELRWIDTILSMNVLMTNCCHKNIYFKAMYIKLVWEEIRKRIGRFYRKWDEKIFFEKNILLCQKSWHGLQELLLRLFLHFTSNLDSLNWNQFLKIQIPRPVLGKNLPENSLRPLFFSEKVFAPFF